MQDPNCLQLGLGIPGDVMCHGQRAERPGLFRMHAPFGDHLLVEMRQFFKEPCVLKKHGPSFSCRQHVLVVDHRRAGDVRQFLFLSHIQHPFLLGILRIYNWHFSYLLRIYKITWIFFRMNTVTPSFQ